MGPALSRGPGTHATTRMHAPGLDGHHPLNSIVGSSVTLKPLYQQDVKSIGCNAWQVEDAIVLLAIHLPERLAMATRAAQKGKEKPEV